MSANFVDWRLDGVKQAGLDVGTVVFKPRRSVNFCVVARLQQKVACYFLRKMLRVNETRKRLVFSALKEQKVLL